ncbi:MAG: hypothetical protein II005_03905 [Turicibacter sp.]|nr:hypothetical protein [Turicibacter sp.]MBQ1802020.1 hypothetical protein [Lachnobacterium sp.]
MQTFLLVSIIIIILSILVGMMTFRMSKQGGQKNIKDEIEDCFVNDNDINGKVTIVEVQFRQYNGRYTYSVMQQHPKKGQHVLVLTQDGIRCAKVVTDPKTVRTSQLSIPPFLLQNIICVADASDLEYYN